MIATLLVEVNSLDSVLGYTSFAVLEWSYCSVLLVRGLLQKTFPGRSRSARCFLELVIFAERRLMELIEKNKALVHAILLPITGTTWRLWIRSWRLCTLIMLNQPGSSHSYAESAVAVPVEKAPGTAPVELD